MDKKRSKMNKKAQFFIIFAVILGIIILSLATIFNTIIKTGREETAPKKFALMCKNYKEEVFRVSEHAINTSNKSGEAGLILDFTKEFMSYAEKTDPNFGLVYVYGNNNYVNILDATDYEIVVEDYDNWQSLNGYRFIEIIGPVDKIILSSEKVNKQYEIDNNEKFWFIALTEKDGEEYVCE
ncbi:MAG: hypothetical protein IB618_01675 [Candidatus Pacearchaeota archaeon]|nr:MAG: hypothetical protein IB618_01675 [Candidatus Pacearchaeota archaeon]